MTVTCTLNLGILQYLVDMDKELYVKRVRRLVHVRPSDSMGFDEMGKGMSALGWVVAGPL